MRLGIENDVDLAHKKNRIRVTAKDAPIDRGHMLEKLHRRYGIEECEVCEIEEALRSIQSVPVLLRGFSAIAKLEFDYA